MAAQHEPPEDVLRRVQGEGLRLTTAQAQWHEKGARHNGQVERNIRLVAAIALALGVIWFFA